LKFAKAGSSATPIVLVVLAAGTAAYAYFVDRARISDADRAARRTDVFPSFRVDDVRRVEMVHGAETLVLDREALAGASGPPSNTSSKLVGSSAVGWAMESPHRDATDPAAIDILLRELEMATRVRDVRDDDARGLDSPRVRGTLDVGPVEYRFALGADTVAPEGDAYMRIEGEGTFVVGRSLKVQLLRGADAYRDRALVPYGMSDVARIELRAPGGAVVALERRGTAFRVGGVSGLRASRAEVDRLFGALADARAETFLDDVVADRAVGPQARAVVITPRDPARPRLTLLVGGACPSDDPVLKGDVVVVRLEPSRASACATGRLTEALGASAESLVDESPFVANADEMEELRLEPVGTGGPRIDLARRGAGWHERAPDERDLDADEVDSANGLAASLASSRALDARRAEAGERITVRARATIVRTGGESSEVIEVAAPDASGVALARRVDDGAILRLPRAAARRFEPHPIAIEAGPIWRTNVDPGAVVAVDDTCGRVAERLELDDGVWKARGYAVDNLSASNLVESFARARASAWVAETDDGTFGFGREGSCAVTLTLQSPGDGGAPRRIGLTFGDGNDADGTLYARTTDGNGVLLAPSALRDLASHPAIDRGRLRLDPSAMSRIVIERGGAKLVLSRVNGDSLVRVVDPHARLDAGAPDETDEADKKLASAFDGFYADCAVHAGPAVANEGMDHPTLAIEATSRGTGGAPVETRIAVGAETKDGYFARVAGVDATFDVPRAAVQAILDAL
jgi:hypothetical protein